MRQRRRLNPRSEGLRILMEAHHRDLLRYMQRRLPDHEVDGAVAEVFATAWKRLDQVPDGKAALPWLYAVGRHSVLHRNRSAARQARLQQRLHLQPTRTVADPAESISEREILQLAAVCLSDDERELLQLVSWEQLRIPELAEFLGCSTNAASIRVHRMRKKLQQNIDQIRGDHNCPDRPTSKPPVEESNR